METEQVIEKITYENTVFNGLFKAVEAVKERTGFYLGIMSMTVLLNFIPIYTTSNKIQDDMTVILSAVITILVSLLHGVFVLNFFNFSFDKKEFSFSKTLWDLPTYAFYTFAVGIIISIGLILLVIPGLFLAYFYTLVPMVAILFDEQDKSNFKITSNKVKALGWTYVGLGVIKLIIAIISGAVTNYAPMVDIPIGIVYALAIVLAFVNDVFIGAAVALFKYSK